MSEVVTSDWVVRLRPDSHPREVALEISTACNLNCIHCFRKSAPGLKEGYMSMDVLKKVLDNVVNAGVGRVVLTGWGEPLTHPEVEEVIKSCRERGLQVVLNTNGFRLLELSGAIVEWVDELALSVDAPTAELYSVIRAGGSLPPVLSGLRRLLEFKRLSGSVKPYVKLLYTVNRLNAGEAGRLLELARVAGVNEVVYSYYIPLAEGDGLDCLNDPECVKLFGESVSRAKSVMPELSVRISMPAHPVGVQRSCPFASNRALYIRCDGLVTPCIYYSRNWGTNLLNVRRRIHEVLLGDASSEPLTEIWRSRYGRMFYKLSFSRIPSCLTCKLVEYCGRTRSNDSDCLGNTPTCAHCPFYHGLTYCPL